MTITPRHYQIEAVDAVFDYWNQEPGNPLVDLATGTGKSLCLTMLIQRLLCGWPHMRIMVVTHVAELILQNYEELMGVWPFAPAGIYSAGVGRRDANSTIIFAGIQTVYNKALEIGHIDVLMVDEAHLIPVNAETMYGKFIAALCEINPDLKIVGLTATPYRLDSGRLDVGENRLFDKVVYTYGITDGINDGYLAPLTSKGTSTGFDLTGVGTLGGDYKQSALAAAVDKSEIYESAVNEIVKRGADRRSWLVFGAGVENALHIRDAIRGHGISCETVTGETNKDERRRILDAFKNYEIRAITNNSVLTTGFNHKGVDLIAFMRPTKSVSLFVQMGGRGTRALYAPGMPLDTPDERKAAIAAGPKPNCLAMDFAKLAYTHGPLDLVQPKTPGKGNGEPPVKLCPECKELIHISVMKCTACGYDFPPSEVEKITPQAGSAPIISTDTSQWLPVSRRIFSEHPGKTDETGWKKPDTVKTGFDCGLKWPVNTWQCPGHGVYPKGKFAKDLADKFWNDHGGLLPEPDSSEEWLLRQHELADTAEVLIRYKGQYPEIKAWRVAANDNAPPVKREWSAILDDEIPF